MSYRILAFEPTPNPNALKCTLDRAISDQPRSFLKASDAQDDALASSLFHISGIRCVLMNGDWITINKQDDAAWGPIKKSVRAVLREAP